LIHSQSLWITKDIEVRQRVRDGLGALSHPSLVLFSVCRSSSSRLTQAADAKALRSLAKAITLGFGWRWPSSRFHAQA